MNPNRFSVSSSPPSSSAVSPPSSRNHSPSPPLRRPSSSTSISTSARDLSSHNSASSPTPTPPPPSTSSTLSSSYHHQHQILHHHQQQSQQPHHRTQSDISQKSSDMTVVQERPRERESHREKKSAKIQRSIQQQLQQQQQMQQHSTQITPVSTVSKATAPLISEATYVIPPPPSIAFGGNSTSLGELAHLVRLQSYQSLKHTQCRVRLHRQLINSAISARLNRSAELARSHMVDFFKNDQKRDFAVLYNAVHDLMDSCERLALLQPELDITKTVTGDPDSERPRMLVTFLHEVPAKARDTILQFVAMIRSNPKFLADRLAKLTPLELDNLARHHTPAVAPDSSSTSVLAAGRKGATPAAPALPALSAVEKLLSFQRHDPIYTLVHTVFANSTGPESAEDRRRVDVWATACAKLLNNKKGEKFLLAVMDAWAAMREWPARGNLETCLMSFLQEGAFLLERNEEQPAPVKGQPDLKKHDHMSEEFYSRAVRKLFEVLDDEPSAGGIPEGILELGNAILDKIEDPAKKKYACGFIVANWFFGKFLYMAIQYPEYHGMMVGHHITEYARQKIFRTIFQRMYTAVFNISYAEWKRSAPMEPAVRQHIENIMARFRCARPKDSNPVLMPAKSVTAPRETAEVQPFIVVSAADIVTMYNALFPQSTQMNTAERDILNKRYPRSVSSRPLLSRPPSIFETSAASVISHGSSSVMSESAMSGPSAPLLVQTQGNTRMEEGLFGSPTMQSPNSFTMMAPSLKPSGASIHSIQSMASEQDLQMENFFYEVKTAVSDMVRAVGLEATTSRVHPCAEKWAVLFVSPDGNELSTRMRTDWDDDDDDDEDGGHDSDSEDEAVGEGSGLDRDYNQLKEAVMKLVEDYEVPEELIAENENRSKKFSNRTSAAARKPASPVASSLSGFLPEQSQFHGQSGLTALFERSPSHERQRLDLTKEVALAKISDVDQPPVLLTMLSAASSQCTLRGDFVDGQLFHRAIMQLQRLSPSLMRNGYSALLHIFSRGFRDSIEKSAGAMEHLDAWFAWLTLAQERYDAANEDLLLEIKNLRVKMWYVTDVRNSAAYDDARNVSLALKKMGIPVKPSGKPGGSSKSRGRMSSSSFSLLKSDSLIDTLAASNEHGGPNKLVDDQAEITTAWLKRYDIQNFCQGEERIHRFCCEVDKCVNKLVGDKILTGPVLWSSELFARDERELASVRRKGDFHLAGVGALSMALDDGYETESTSRRNDAGLKSKTSAGDLFSLGRNRSQSIISTTSDALTNRTRGGRGSGGESMMDRQDFLGGQSPSMSVDSPPSSAFWSPFATSSTSSSATSRPKTQQPSNALTTAKASPEHESLEKKNFLTQLKQTLTGLLLSDIGMDVWSQGSETDAWFSGGLGDECLQRKEDQEAATRKSLAEKNASAAKLGAGSVKKISRKKSAKNLKKSGIFEALGKGEKGELAAPIATFENVGHEPHSGEENSSSSDATARSSHTAAVAAAAAIRKGGVLPFPYGVAFRRLLLKFSTHPNPHAKLRALYDLEVLIVASLSSATGKTLVRRGALSSLTASNDALGEITTRMTSLMTQPTNPDESLASVDERRHAGVSASPFMTPTGARSPVMNAVPSTDMIVEVWQQLFRQADIRPRTLFRDLQFVAAFVDSHTLDMTDMGKAFWDMAYAALTLKVEVCKTMVEVADEIVGYHTKRRGAESAAAAAAATAGDKNPDKMNLKGVTPVSGTSTPPQEWIARYTMKDAAKMWLITAKEGDPTAQRELAIFYLTNPSLLPLVTSPLSKTKNIFRTDVMSAKGVDPEKCDPARLCVSHHWMELSAREDDLAKKYLRQREDQW